MSFHRPQTMRERDSKQEQSTPSSSWRKRGTLPVSGHGGA